MYEIQFYENKNGRSEVREWYDKVLEEQDTSKFARQRYEKLRYYLDILKKDGTYSGYPYVKDFRDGMWELRPGDDRIIFFVAKGNEIILLHQFIKVTRKTPDWEIKKAQSRLKDWQKRYR